MLLALVIVVVIIFVVTIYNKLVKMRNHANEAWSDIDVQLKRRYNLIPNIVETVKGYAEHEESVFTKVTEARNNAINAGNMKEQAQAEDMLSGALKSLFAVAESYPDLKANENFMQLQNELVDTEDKIQAARRFYNGTVRDYNTKLQQFPNNIIAGAFKFEAKEFFEVEDEEQKKNVEVSFDKDEKKEEMTPAAPAEPEAPAETPAEPAPETPAEEKPAEPEAPATPAEPETPAEPTPEVPAEQPVAASAEEPKEEEVPSLPIEEAPAEAAPKEEEEKKEEGEEEEKKAE